MAQELLFVGRQFTFAFMWIIATFLHTYTLAGAVPGFAAPVSEPLGLLLWGVSLIVLSLSLRAAFASGFGPSRGSHKGLKGQATPITQPMRG